MATRGGHVLRVGLLIFHVSVLYSSVSILGDFTFVPLHFKLKYPAFDSTTFVTVDTRSFNVEKI